jgi:2-oxoglutarate dehydrogenase E1 component
MSAAPQTNAASASSAAKAPSASPAPAPPALNGWNAEYLQAQYDAWKSDPAAVGPDLAAFFDGFEQGLELAAVAPRLGEMPAARPLAAAATPAGPGQTAAGNALELRVANLVRAYREYAHMGAAIDPFGRERPAPAELDPAAHGLTDADMQARLDLNALGIPATGDGSATLADLVDRLKRTYLGSIGLEVGHMTSGEERRWFTDRFERNNGRPDLSKGERAHVLYQLHRAELFERFCGKRYPGQKRFSLEGGESLIPMLDRIVEKAADDFGSDELVFGMSHRGRLNVLTNIVGKTFEQIFTEFDDAWSEDAEMGGGDVKYHRGFSSSRVLPSGKHVWLSMSSNPSHLEAVGPVLMGRVRAKQRLKGDLERTRTIPVLMHGDAAVIAQGVVAETYNMSLLPGYTVGGCIHIVVNNLIGFTTGQEDARSSRYCTDMAKMIEAPVLHVNGEDPEAVVFAAQLALEYRQHFAKDVVIDLVCYRRHGHNETDEAMFTQPLLYKEIKKKKTVLESYADFLLSEGVISKTDVDEIKRDLEENLDAAYASARKTPVDPTPDPGHKQWTDVHEKNEWSFDFVETGVSETLLDDVARALSAWPEGFEPHRRLQKTLKQRTDSVVDRGDVDWATGEALAIGTLLCEGRIIRFSGQDSRRGTFSQRHAALRDVNNADVYVPLNHIREMGVAGDPDREVGTRNDEGVVRQGRFGIYDSPLSEYAVLGFEYGFSLASPKVLAIWEAQFGDFGNGAQVIIDQFIASAELKWHRWSGITLLLPHGYEGQGPEHSSARLERFLKLSAQNNMQVVHPTTPAQMFHVLRRQMHRPFRKPLIVMTPKSLLRLPECRSGVEEFTAGGFREFLDDPRFDGASKKTLSTVTRVILCSGKVYYDLIRRRDDVGREDVAIVRAEQLAPVHCDALKAIRERYPDDAELMWVQEEPMNMGGYGHMAVSLRNELGWGLAYAGRPASGTPATGSPSKHLAQLDEFLTQAIGPKPDAKPQPADKGDATSGDNASANGRSSKKRSGKKTAAA